MRTGIAKHVMLRMLIDRVEENGTFPKVYSIAIAEIEPGTRDANWTAVISSPSLPHPGFEATFGAIAASVAENHNLSTD